MPSHSAKGCFVELNDHSLVVVRTSAAPPIVVEQVEEIRCETNALPVDALDKAAPETKEGPVNSVCVWRPAGALLHLATADEAKRHASREAIAALLAQSRSLDAAALDLACMQAEDGAAWEARSSGRWLAAGVARADGASVIKTMRDRKLVPVRIESATLAMLGAGQQILAQARDSGPLAMWEIAESASTLFLVNAAGVQAVRRVGFGFGEVVEAIAAEMNLRFKASAAKLFFNDLYDFSELGPKIAARVAAKLQAELDAIKLSSGHVPASFLCAGFTSKQDWFTEGMAAALKLSPWRPDIAAWCEKAEIRFAPSVVPAQVSPIWCGLLGTVAACRGGQIEVDHAWHPVWFRDPAVPVAAPKPVAPVAAAAKPAPVAESKPAPAPAPAAAKPVPAPAAAKAAPAPTVAKAAPAPAPAKPVEKPQKPAPAPAPVAKKPDPAPARPAPAVEKKDAPKPAPAPAPVAAASAARKPFFATPVGIAAAVALVAALGGGYYFFNQSQEQKAAMLREKQLSEQRAAADAEALRQFREKAAEEAEARRRAEQLAAEQVAAAEKARQLAAEEARRAEEEHVRLLNARGSMKIVSEPAGATVTIESLASKQTPALYEDLRLGRYVAEIAMEGYDAATVELEVKENSVAEAGVIELVRQTGAVELASQPVGVAFELRPISARFALSSPDIKRGETPARLTGLPTGEYIVSLRREGWPAYTETVVIERNAMARVSRTFSGGAVNVTSVPQGAAVLADGVKLGVTPLTLDDVRLGEVTYTIALDDFYTTTVSGEVGSDKPLDLTATLAPVDRIRRNSELDEKPVPIKTVYPQITESNKYKGMTVLFSLVVDEDGSPREIKVERSSNPELTELCREAINQWLFKPATVRGQPVKARVAVPFVIQ